MGGGLGLGSARQIKTSTHSLCSADLIREVGTELEAGRRGGGQVRARPAASGSGNRTRNPVGVVRLCPRVDQVRRRDCLLGTPEEGCGS